MGRLGVLIVLLAVVIAAAVVVQLRVAPQVALSPMAQAAMPKKLSRADQKKLETLKATFVIERDRYLQLKKSGASADKLAAQKAKASEAAKAVVTLGGEDALKSVGKSKYAPEEKSGAGAPGRSGAKGVSSESSAAGGSCSGGASCSGSGGTCSVDFGAEPAEKAVSKAAAKGAPARAAKAK